MDGFAIVIGGAAKGARAYDAFEPPSAHFVGLEEWSSSHCWVVFQQAYDAVLRFDPSAHIDVSASALPIRKAVRVPFVAVQAPGYSYLAKVNVNHTTLFQDTEARLLRVWEGEPIVTYRRSSAIEEETFEDDLLLFQREDRTVITLNKAAACLWEALHWPHTLFDLRALLIEAGVTKSQARAAQIVASVMDRLIEHRFVLSIDS